MKQIKLGETLYEAPFDNGEYLGLDKETVKYLTDKKSAVYKTMSTYAASRGYRLSPEDLDDIYTEAVFSAYTKPDYKIERAIVDGEIVPLEGYIFSILKYSMLKYVNSRAKRRSMETPDTVTVSDKNGEEQTSIFDLIEDEKSPKYEADISVREACQLAECKRYACGVDIFLALFITMFAKKLGKEENVSALLSALGIEQLKLDVVSVLSKKDTTLNELITAVKNAGVSCIDVLREYVYAADKIEEALNM